MQHLSGCAARFETLATPYTVLAYLDIDFKVSIDIRQPPARLQLV